MKRLMLDRWGIEDERDKSGLSRKIDWRSFFKEVAIYGSIIIISIGVISLAIIFFTKVH